MYARIQALKLTDGSEVFNVLIDSNDNEERCKIECASETAAMLLVDTINTQTLNIEFY